MYAATHDVHISEHTCLCRQGIMVLGSGVYRIGNSVEFDYSTVMTARTIRQEGYKTIMVNFNPETVSTDYDESDKLYFEEITLERVLDVYEHEGANGVIISMGGQTPQNLVMPLAKNGARVLGTPAEMIDNAENRQKFSEMLDRIGVDQPLWSELITVEQAKQFADKVGYPVLVRPSYVLSGAAMNRVNSAEQLAGYLSEAVSVSPDHPVVISKFMEGWEEIDADAVAQNGEMKMYAISEHIEYGGVHSGDASMVLPSDQLPMETKVPQPHPLPHPLPIHYPSPTHPLPIHYPSLPSLIPGILYLNIPTHPEHP